MKNFVVQTWTRNGSQADQFNDIDLAKRHARLNGGGLIFHRSQVSRILNGSVHLHAHDAEPMYSE